MQFVEMHPIYKGYSGDKKYCVTAKDGTKYLLRTSPIRLYSQRRTEFQLMRRVAALQIPMCQPIKFGICRKGVYSLQSWIDGADLEDVLPDVSEEAQYNYGLAAGKILRKMHTIPAPKTQEPWERRFNRKMDRKIKMYSECPLKYENGDLFIQYIEKNRALIRNRPQTYQHGDYHVGNMMADRAGQLQIIDFNRHDFGDPWEEFNRIVWAAQASPRLASGMVDGYFNCDVPLEFWRLLALYISSNTLSSLPWGIPFGAEQVAVFREQAQDILRWYDNMQNVIPSWYR